MEREYPTPYCCVQTPLPSTEVKLGKGKEVTSTSTTVMEIHSGVRPQHHLAMLRLAIVVVIKPDLCGLLSTLRVQYCTC